MLNQLTAKKKRVSQRPVAQPLGAAQLMERYGDEESWAEWQPDAQAHTARWLAHFGWRPRWGLIGCCVEGATLAAILQNNRGLVPPILATFITTPELNHDILIAIIIP